MMPGFGITHDTIRAERELLHKDLERRRILRESQSTGAGTASRGARLLTVIQSRFADGSASSFKHSPVASHIDFSRRQGA
jgi:hypothetical protein